MTHSRDKPLDPAQRGMRQLSTRHLGRSLRSRETVTSTNELALRWAAEGAPHGALVYAEYQERGRGRLGRTWSAGAGVNLLFSVVLRPVLAPDSWGLITIASCVAVSAAIETFTSPVRTQIKWPNDVLIDGRKCSGILLESTWPARREKRVVVMGIGINVNQQSFPEELTERATSLLLETGRPVSRTDLLVAVLENLEKELDLLPDGASDVRRRYMNRMRDLNEPVELRFTEDRGSMRGVAAGLSDDGGLILATDEGMRVCHAGDVTRSA